MGKRLQLRLEDAERISEKERIFFEKQSAVHALEVERLKKDAERANHYIQNLESNVYIFYFKKNNIEFSFILCQSKNL